MKIKILIFGMLVLLLLSGTVSTAYALTNSTDGINPRDAEAWFNKGFSLYGAGKYEEAIVAYDKAIEINPRYADAWNNKGGALDNLGRHEEAIMALDKAIEINPRYADAWSNKGKTLNDLGRQEEAIMALDKAIEINPRHAGAWYNKGNALRDLKRYEDALVAYNKAIEINPMGADAWNNKGNTLNNLGKYEDAIVAYNKAIEINPQHAEAWNNKGGAFYNLNRYEEAIIAYNKAIEINPNYAEAWRNIGVVLSDMGRFEEAIVAFNKSIEINPNYAIAWFKKGNVFYYLKKYEDAIFAYNKAIEINPQYGDAWNNKAVVLRDIGKYEDAKVAFGKAIEINPRYIEEWVNTVKAQQNLERYPELIGAIYMEPRTGQIINQLELTNIKALLDTNSIGDKPISIDLSYVFEGSNVNETFYLVNNSYYFGEPIIVDLNKRNDFPFEDYNTTIFISINDKNYTNRSFFKNTTIKNMTIDAWGQARTLNFIYKGNKIEITMDRANKRVSEWMYGIGLAIILSYMISFIIIYRKSPFNPDMFAFFNSFSFIFFVALVIAGVREYLFSSIWGQVFLFIILVFFVIFVYKKINSRKQDNTSEFKREFEILKADMKEMLKQNEEKITEMKEMLNAELMHDYEGLKPK